MNFLIWIKKNLVIVIPICMISGFLFGVNTNTAFLKITIIPLTFLMVYPMMINLQIKKIFEGGDTIVQIVAQGINFLIIPVLAYGLGQYFFPDNYYLALGLLLTGLLPTSGMTISWTGMARGNMAAAIKMTVFGLIIGSILAPIYIKFMMGTEISINILKIFQQIIIIVLLPLILGNMTQRLLIRRYGLAHYNEKLKKVFPSFSTLGVVGIVFVAMALKAKSVLSNPTILLQILIPLAIFYVLNIIISILIGKLFFKRNNAIALLYGTVMRNLSIALAIAMTAFGKEGADIALVIALGYIIQVQLAAWVVTLTNKLFGPPVTEKSGNDLIHEGLFALHSNNTLLDAISILNEENIHSITILDKNEKPLGMLTLQRAIDYIADRIPLDTLLNKLTLEKLVTIEINKSISEIARKMKNTHEYKVLLVNDSGNIKGVVTAHDILKSM